MPIKKNKEGTIMQESEEETSVYWLRKIFEKLEAIEQQQNSCFKKMEETMDNLASEIKTKACYSNVQQIGTDIKDYHNGNRLSKANPIINIEELIKKRKHAYYNQIRSNGISAIYKEFLKLNPPFIPKKFREGHMPGESEAQKKRINTLETTRVTLECERLDEEAAKNESIVKSVENDVGEKIGKLDCPEKRQGFKEKWIKASQAEEKISDNIWQKKKVF